VLQRARGQHLHGRTSQPAQGTCTRQVLAVDVGLVFKINLKKSPLYSLEVTMELLDSTVPEVK
jgi:hypothetical protein